MEFFSAGHLPDNSQVFLESIRHGMLHSRHGFYGYGLKFPVPGPTGVTPLRSPRPEHLAR